METLSAHLPRLGHRNWVAVVDAAFPEMVAPGVTLLTGGDLAHVVASLDAAKHVRYDLFLDSEIDRLTEQEAPGITRFKTQLDQILAEQEPTKLPHEDLIKMLDEAAKTFRVLIIKTDVLIPYTSVFFRLECGYWNAASEARLRVHAPE